MALPRCGVPSPGLNSQPCCRLVHDPTSSHVNQAGAVWAGNGLGWCRGEHDWCAVDGVPLEVCTRCGAEKDAGPTLSEFLLARIADDEAAAREAERLSHYAVRVGSDRVLAECEAKRRIVNVFWDMNTQERTWTLQLLARAYNDHPDYRKEWTA